MSSLFLWITAAIVLCQAESLQSDWQKLEEGLDYAEFKSFLLPTSGDSVVSVLRIDPKFFQFRYLVASEFDSVSLLTKEWANKYGLSAVINAGMYMKDYLTHVGYSKHKGHVHNARVLKKYKSVLAFDPVDKSLPEVQLLDLECQNFSAMQSKYATMIQNIRMINCHGNNVWSQRPDTWSTAALGQDSSGKMLFLFARSPYSVHDFIRILMHLPLSIARAMYLEGGSPACIYIKVGSRVIDKSGLVNENDADGATFPQALPNVIGIVRKVKKTGE